MQQLIAFALCVIRSCGEQGCSVALVRTVDEQELIWRSRTLAISSWQKGHAFA